MRHIREFINFTGHPVRVRKNVYLSSSLFFLFEAPKELLHALCARLRVLVPSVSIALAETVLSGQVMQMAKPPTAHVVHVDTYRGAIPVRTR